MPFIMSYPFKASTGTGGRCSKERVVKMMSKILKQKDPLHHHIADAAAVAIAGILREPL